MFEASAIEAAVLLCGYDIGSFDKTDVASWADRQIEAAAVPAIELIDLSMIRQTHPLDVIKLLRSLGPTEDSTLIEIQLGFIGLLFEQHKLTTRLAIRGIWRLVHEAGITPEQQTSIYCLDDGYDLAVAGTYATIRGIGSELQGTGVNKTTPVPFNYPWSGFTSTSTTARGA